MVCLHLFESILFVIPVFNAERTFMLLLLVYNPCYLFFKLSELKIPFISIDDVHDNALHLCGNFIIAHEIDDIFIDFICTLVNDIVIESTFCVIFVNSTPVKTFHGFIVCGELTPDPFKHTRKILPESRCVIILTMLQHIFFNGILSRKSFVPCSPKKCGLKVFLPVP